MPAITPSETRPGLSLAIETVTLTARQRDRSRLPILAIDELVVPAGGRVAVTGPSGAGKSSLLGILSGIVRPDRGRVSWGGEDVSALSERRRDRWRRRHVGLVFQDFHLVPELCVLGNVLMPARFESFRIGRATLARAEELLASVGLYDPRRRAGLLSRGEQQRAAIARALLLHPTIILADEPTASLDEQNGRDVIELLVGTAEQSGATLVVATHDPALIARVPEHRRLERGRLVEGARA